MVKGSIRGLLICAISALFVIGLSGTADAACNCFCKVAKDLGASPGPSIPNFLIQYDGLPSWANCLVGVPAKKQQCSYACSNKTASDATQYGNDQWLCNKINADYINGRVVAYSAIGTHNYDSAASKNLSCKKCCPAGSNYASSLDRCLRTVPPPFSAPGIQDGVYGSWCGHKNFLYSCVPTNMVVGTSC
jgi:hypothetical protein